MAAVYSMEPIQLNFWTILGRHLRMPLPKVPGPVAVLPQDVGIQRRDGFWLGFVALPRRSIRPTRQATQNSCTTHPTNRMTHESVAETRAAFGQGIDIRRLDDIVAVATNRARGLIIREKEDDVGLFRRRSTRITKQQDENWKRAARE